MTSGMLWLDSDRQRSLEEKVDRAARYYQQKYGRRPNVCLVWRGLLSEEKEIAAIQVMPVTNMVRDHFLLGVKAPH